MVSQEKKDTNCNHFFFQKEETTKAEKELATGNSSASEIDGDLVYMDLVSFSVYNRKSVLFKYLHIITGVVCKKQIHS